MWIRVSAKLLMGLIKRYCSFTELLLFYANLHHREFEMAVQLENAVQDRGLKADQHRKVMEGFFRIMEL